MTGNEFDPRLPSNRLIFDARRDKALYEGFKDRLEDLMTRYDLSDGERIAWRNLDLKALRALGVHPYFLPQITRLIFGSRRNDNDSEAAQAFKRALGADIVQHKK